MMSEHTLRMVVGWATLVSSLAVLCQIFILFRLRTVVREARRHIEALTQGAMGTMDAVATLRENWTHILVMAESASSLYRNAERLAQRAGMLVKAVIRATRFIRHIGDPSRRIPRAVLELVSSNSKSTMATGLGGSAAKSSGGTSELS